MRPALICVLVLVFCNACSQTNSAANMLSESSLARQIQSQYPVLNNPQINDYLRRLVSKLSNNQKVNTVPIQVVILKSPTVIALASASGEVLLSSALIKSFTNESQLAFILAHEIAHIQYGHQVNASDPATAFSVTRELELQADKAAMSKILSAGFDPRQALLALAQVYRLKGINEKSHSHPDLAQRVFQLQTMLASSHWSASANSAQREFNWLKLQL